MCVTILCDGKEIQTLGELRRKLHREPVYLDPVNYHNDQTPDEYCLCGVDLEATAALIGTEYDFDGMFAYYLPEQVTRQMRIVERRGGYYGVMLSAVTELFSVIASTP